MAAGVLLELNPHIANAVDKAINTARQAFVAGVRQLWVPQFYDFDAISLAGIVGAAVPGLRVGTAAVPINPRHPLTVSSAAQTAQAAAHGNFSLGLGFGAHSVERHSYGISAVHTIERLREHLSVLRSIQTDGAVKHHGQQITAVSPAFPVVLPGGVPYPIYVAAMGPRALQVTGELAGPHTIEDFMAPTLNEAATKLAFYDTVRSYRTVMDREGVAGAADLAVIGSASWVMERLRAYVDAGATDLVLSSISTESVAMRRLWEVAANL